MATAALAETIAGLQGGSYVVGMNGDKIVSLTNDDGTIVNYHYDASGNGSGLTVFVDGVALNLQYSSDDSNGSWVQAGSLPPLFCINDEYGRTVSAALYPNIRIENGEWYLDVSGPDPIYAASFAYGAAGHLASVTLNNGLSMQLVAPTAAGVVQQSLYAGDGTLMQSASPTGGQYAARVLPTQLDAVATQLGLGADWAETLTFSVNPSGHLTTGRNANGQVMVYLVDAGPTRVGYTPDGTAIFYDFTPWYGSGDGSDVDAATQLSGVAPTSIVMTADGATGMYTDRPAEGAVYGAWIDANDSARFAQVEAPTSNLRSPASQSIGRPSKKRSDFYRPIRTKVCVTVSYCWEHTYWEWVDEGNPDSGGGGRPPAEGGGSPSKATKYAKDPVLNAVITRSMNKAKEKLKKANCRALLDRLGIYGQKLIDVMHHRHYNDPSAYLTSYPIYVEKPQADCPPNAVADTKPLSQTVVICSSFGNWNDGKGSVFLIHEMMHTLGYGEGPKIPGFPTSAEINAMVSAACGAN